MPIMFFDSKDPYLNLATEEVLFEQYDLIEDLFIIWFSQPAFIVGRNQNAFLEVNPEFSNIPVIRRISGGGTIYQDLNTINFSYITKNYHNKINNYIYFLTPFINALKDFGLDIKFKPKSHLVLDGLKISGNAQAFKNNRLLHHGTLLFDTNLKMIEKALLQYNPKSLGNQVASNKQNVTNLKEYLPQNISIIDIVNQIVSNVCTSFNIRNEVISVTKSIQQKAMNLVHNKYFMWEWNYGKTPVFHIRINESILKIEKGHVVEVSDKKCEDLLGLKYQSKEYVQKLFNHKKTA